MFLDEASVLFPFKTDSLVKQLREIEVVPKASYIVQNQQVFVFEALLNTVIELSENSSDSITQLALQALPSAWVSAQEAVTQYRVIPAPYKRVEADGELAILHEPFNALLPPRFEIESDRNHALAQLLLGEILPGPGKFAFRGQNMTLLEPMDFISLPSVPELNVLGLYAPDNFYSHLKRVAYEPGFPFLSEEKFDTIKNLEFTWLKANAAIRRHIYSVADWGWENLANLNLLTYFETPEAYTKVPDYAQQDLLELRNLYPELADMKDTVLYWQYDEYHFGCNHVRGWEATRSDEFLYYLLGILAIGEEVDGEKTRDVGEFVGFQLIQFKNIERAIMLGRVWLNYDTALHSLAWRTYEVVRFLKQLHQHSESQGSPITTFSDILARSRKSNI